MRKSYVKPCMMGEAFVANEYVASCFVGMCDITSSQIYEWHDKNNDGEYQADEKGDRLMSWFLFFPDVVTNTACGSDDVKKVSGDMKRMTPVVCLDATHNGQSYEAIKGWLFAGVTPSTGYNSTHVSSIRPTSSNAS